MYSNMVTGPAMYPFLSRTVIADSDRHTAMMIKFVIVKLDLKNREDTTPSRLKVKLNIHAMKLSVPRMGIKPIFLQYHSCNRAILACYFLIIAISFLLYIFFYYLHLKLYILNIYNLSSRILYWDGLCKCLYSNLV